MAEYFLTLAAEEDFKSILQYIAADNLKQAEKVRDRFYDIFDKIARYPFMGHAREDITKKEVRFISIYSYFIVYSPNKNPVEIVRILSGYRDVKNII